MTTEQSSIYYQILADAVDSTIRQRKEMDELKGHLAAVTNELLALRAIVGRIVGRPEDEGAAPPTLH